MVKAEKAPVEPADLSAFDGFVAKQNEGFPVDIVGPDGKTPLGYTIRIAGPDSEKAMKARELLSDELADREEIKKLYAAEINARGIRYLAMITIGWEPSVKMDGRELEFSEENAVALYQRFAFIRDQVDAKAGRREVFLNG